MIQNVYNNPDIWDSWRNMVSDKIIEKTINLNKNQLKIIIYLFLLEYIMIHIYIFHLFIKMHINLVY